VAVVSRDDLEMSDTIRIISSMATKRLLADLVAAFERVSPHPHVTVESVGGVDAAKRVAAGESFDVVVLASGPIENLRTQGRVIGHRIDLVNSSMAVAVRTGAPRPSIATEDDVRREVLAAPSIGYSTGPSGDHLLGLLQKWAVSDAVKDRLVQARPGIPVASLVAGGEAVLGFQQLSELMNVEGVDVVGLLPSPIQGVTTFSAGVTQASTQPAVAHAMLEFMASPAVAALKRQHGMDPA
jgi:molybdate transport system substrate-binding protein